MTDPSFTDEADRDLLVVLPTREEAEEAARRLLAAGIPADEVLVDREADRMTSLRAEMHGELAEHLVGAHTAESSLHVPGWGLAIGSLIGVAVGVAAAFAFALIDVGDTSYWGRFTVYLLVGVAFGVAIGFVGGPAASSVRPDRAPAIERGTLLRVRHDSASLRHLLAELHPIRMDEIRRADDVPVGHPTDG
jgi:hypothetical protein